MTYLNVIGAYPVTATLAQQNQLLSNISKQIVTAFELIIELEQKRMRDMCSLADIDFEFVLDSSGSIGSKNWGITTDLIAQHWIRETIQPSGSAQCGNHVAIRRYSGSDSWSEGHFYDLDFTPTDEWINADGISNYTDYVANVFTNLDHISSVTDTAGALERVRTEDITKTRNGTTYIMVFTDGESNSFNDTVYQAELLHTLVDEVFAFGIGDNINADELEAIASKDSNMDIMENFQSYRDYISQFILRQGGCNTRHIRPYRAIEFNRPRLTFGLSWETALKSNLSSCEAATVCSNEKEMERKPVCSQCSIELAEIDLEAMEIYRENITTAATNKCFNAALLAGLISQQSRGGALLDQNGTMPCSNTADGLCYGIMGMKNGMHHSLIHRQCNMNHSISMTENQY